MGGYLYIGGMVLLAAALIVWSARTLARCSYTCAHCGGIFHITLRRALFLEHVNRDYRLTCPHCGQKGWCRRGLPPGRKERC